MSFQVFQWPSYRNKLKGNILNSECTEFSDSCVTILLGNFK